MFEFMFIVSLLVFIVILEMFNTINRNRTDFYKPRMRTLTQITNNSEFTLTVCNMGNTSVFFEDFDVEEFKNELEQQFPWLTVQSVHEGNVIVGNSDSVSIVNAAVTNFDDSNISDLKGFLMTCTIPTTVYDANGQEYEAILPCWGDFIEYD